MKDELIKFIKFNAVGILNTAVDFLAYTLLVSLGLNYVASQVISYCLGMLNSYLLNSRWTFSDKEDSPKRVAAFVLVNLASLLVSIGILSLCQNTWGLSQILSKVIALPFSTSVNFVGNRLFVFRRKNQ